MLCVRWLEFPRNFLFPTIVPLIMVVIGAEALLSGILTLLILNLFTAILPTVEYHLIILLFPHTVIDLRQRGLSQQV